MLKPSELTPLTAVALVELLERAGGIPDGVMNLVFGDAPAIGGHKEASTTSKPAHSDLFWLGSDSKVHGVWTYKTCA